VPVDPHRPSVSGIRQPDQVFFASLCNVRISDGAIYEPGVIEIPALQIVELWLHGSQLDVFIKVLEGATNAKAPVELDPDFIDRVLKMALAKTGMHSLSP
jgi:hypothetical protein